MDVAAIPARSPQLVSRQITTLQLISSEHKGPAPPHARASVQPGWGKLIVDVDAMSLAVLTMNPMALLTMNPMALPAIAMTRTRRMSHDQSAASVEKPNGRPRRG
jgi:hypothetical protein